MARMDTDKKIAHPAWPCYPRFNSGFVFAMHTDPATNRSSLMTNQPDMLLVSRPRGSTVKLFTWMLLAAGAAACCVLYTASGAKFNPALLYPEKYPWKFDNDSFHERIILASALLLAIIPFSRNAVSRLLDRLRRPSNMARRLTALAIFLLSGPLLYALAAARHRLMWPVWHDECMYRLQTTFLAHGRLAMPPLQLPDFFDVPYVFVRHCYAPVYFPGTALLHFPAAWLHLPYVLTPLIIASTILALLYLVVTELIDGLSGLLAVPLMISLVLFRWLALTEMSHPAGAMFGLIVIWSWLAWRKSRRTGWIVLAAIAAAWYAITRPLDAMCVLAPVALAWAWDVRREPMQVKLKIAAIVFLLALPFLALQLALDRAATGRWLQSPLDVYNRIYLNVNSLGLQKYDPNFLPPTPAEEVHDTYRICDEAAIRDFQTVPDAARQWVTFRIPTALGVGLPTLLLVFLVPVAVIGLTDIRRRVLWAIFWCYLIGSAIFYLFGRQYVLAIAPALIFTVLLGAQASQQALPARGTAAVFLPLAIGALAIYRIGLNEQGAFNYNGTGTIFQMNYEMIPQKIKEDGVARALVMCRFNSSDAEKLQEPVYNWDVLTPDDAPIIRAHDLGETENVRLYQYYAKTQPDRFVYLFDHMNRSQPLKPLGVVKDLTEGGSTATGEVWSQLPAPSPLYSGERAGVRGDAQKCATRRTTPHPNPLP
jgi:hypothetical protein